GQGTRQGVPKPLLWDSMPGDLKEAMDNVAVVYASTRGVRGALHDETARTPPPPDTIRQALEALPAGRRSRMRRCVVAGSQLVYLDNAGNATKAYNLNSNHHITLWQASGPGLDGAQRRSVTITSMLEAATRASGGEPVFERERAGFEYLMSLCANDLVEWTGDDPGLKRVANISVSRTGQPDIVLRPLRETSANKATRTRIRSSSGLQCMRRRVCLDPIGRPISYEPPEAG
ncbi:MAG TPA: hypothetical protein VGS41_02000, partial [Chthonomonadales bacterium]|nr:hypothetical protein [Chthonomonadales bacterium]